MYTEGDYISDEDKSRENGDILFTGAKSSADDFKSALKEAHDFLKSDKLGNNPFKSIISLADDFGAKYSDFYYKPPSITDIRPIWNSIIPSSVTLVPEFGPENGYGGFKKWQKGKVIGSGSFGTVYEGLDE